MTARFLINLLSLWFLLAVQVSLVFALPFPFDRIPLVLVVVIYAFQYWNIRSVWWWLILYGFILDVLGISPAPLEILSYTIASLVLILLVTHVFTNRSFYGMSATAIISLVVLSIFELLFSAGESLFTDDVLVWQHVLASQWWAVLFSCVVILFIFPLVRRIQIALSRAVLQRL